MSKPHLDGWISSRTPEEGAEAQAISAFLTVLKHRAVLEGADLHRLAQIVESGKSERHRLRAAQLLGGWRQRAADALWRRHVEKGPSRHAEKGPPPPEGPPPEVGAPGPEAGPGAHPGREGRR